MNNNEIEVKSETEEKEGDNKTVEVKMEGEVVSKESSIPQSCEEKIVVHLI